MSRSTIWDSAASTQSWAAVRSMGRGVWRTGLVLLLAFCFLAVLERGGPERHFPLEIRWSLERWRPLLGPACLIPVLATALATWRRLLKSPLLPGRRLLASFAILAVLVLGILAPWAGFHRQQQEEDQCRNLQLPQALEMWQRGSLTSPLPNCPCQWDEGLGSYVLSADPGSEVVIRDSRPWHGGRMLGITRDGRVLTLSADGEIPPR